jgi:hypothetical protein
MAERAARRARRRPAGPRFHRGTSDAADRRKRALAAQAAKRHRRRVARHEATAVVVYGETTISFLLRTRWLSEAQAHDRKAVGEAIGRMVADAARETG